MNIQARKLSFIQEFLRINDDSIIDKLELLIKSEKIKKTEQLLSPMNKNQYHEMIEKAKKESENGSVINHQDLKAKVKSWK